MTTASVPTASDTMTASTPSPTPAPAPTGTTEPTRPKSTSLDFSPLANYACRGALLTGLQQSNLLDVTSAMGPHAFDVDLSQGTITFLPSDDKLPPLILRAHLIASLAPGPRSLLWGWAHPRGDEVSDLLKAQGEKDKVPILTSAEVPFPPTFPPTKEDADESDDDEEEALAKLAHEVATAAVGITLMAPYYCAPNGRSKIVFLLEGEGLPTLTLETVVAKMPSLLANGDLGHDHHAALHGLADAMGWYFHERVEGEDVDASMRDGASCVDFRFDGQGRITNIKAATTVDRKSKEVGNAGREEIKADVRKILESQPKAVEETHGKGGCCVVM